MKHDIRGLMGRIVAKLKKVNKNQKGATMVEYGLMVALVAVVAMVSVKTIGSNASTAFSSAAASIH